MRKNHYQIHRDLLDIIRGCSELEVGDKVYYFKHFSIEEFLLLEALGMKDLSSSKKAGIRNKEDLLRSAIKSGGWSEEKNEKIKSLKWMIKKSMSSLTKMQDKNQRKIFRDQIESQEKELAQLEAEKNELFKYSAESLAETKKIGRMIKERCFLDIGCKKAVPKKLHSVLAPFLFERYLSLNNRDNLLEVSYFGGFFDIFTVQNKNPLALFGDSIKDLTVFQKNLLILSHSLFIKMKNMTIPDEIVGDPLKIYEYEEKEETTANVSHGVDDLREKRRARGGELKAEDFLT